MWKVLSRIFKTIGKEKNQKKAVPTSEALRLLKQSMKEYRKVYEKLAKR